MAGDNRAAITGSDFAQQVDFVRQIELIALVIEHEQLGACLGSDVAQLAR